MLKNNHCYTFLGERKLKKSEKIFDVLGSLDELNTILGIVKVFSADDSLKKIISSIQEDILLAGTQMASFKDFKNFGKKVSGLEKKIEKNADPNLKKFVKPGKNKTEVFLHLARVFCRQTERKVVDLEEKKFQLLVDYLNRLSLLLFWLAVKEGKQK